MIVTLSSRSAIIGATVKNYMMSDAGSPTVRLTAAPC